MTTEVNILRKISSPHCLKMYEMYETENSIYLVLELIEGGDLLKRIHKKQPFKELDIRLLMQNLLEATSHFHSLNIIHRDLKPDNILLRSLNNNHDIVIADFGLGTELIPGQENEILYKHCGIINLVN